MLGTIIGASLLGVAIYVEQPNTYKFPIRQVIDGDTIEVDAPFLPEELKQKLSVRILGIDTPEKGNLAKCELENQKSIEAKKFVEKTLSEAKEIKLTLKSWDKYGGRVLGDFLVDGKPLSKMIIDKGYAVKYHGEKKSTDWCVGK